MTRKLELELKHLVFALIAITLYILWLYPLFVSITRYNKFTSLGSSPSTTNADIITLHKQHNYVGIVGRCSYGVKYQFLAKSQLYIAEDKINCPVGDKTNVGNTVGILYNPSNPTKNITAQALRPTVGNIMRNFLFGMSAIFVSLFAYHYWRLPYEPKMKP